MLETIPEVSNHEILLFVDQFEELFRYARLTTGSGSEAASWREEATQFVQLLVQAARQTHTKVHVLLTMRSDFIGDCARFQDLPEAVSGSQFLVPALTRDQREEVIRRPILSVGGSIDPILVERILNDASDELDQLPILQHCLQRLWEKALSSGGSTQVLIKHYEAIGGIQHGLSRHADEILASLAGDGIVVEQMFRALSEIDRENRATRRALPFEQLLAETGVEENALRRVMDRFRASDCSFLVPSESSAPTLMPDTRVDVGHEAFLRRWERISGEENSRIDPQGRRGGWLWDEENDGRIYRALITLLQYGRTLPLDQVEARQSWWGERPRTSAWADRYGGQFGRVQQLFLDSQEALQRELSRLASAKRAEEEYARERELALQAQKERAEERAKAARQAKQRRRERLALFGTGSALILALFFAAEAYKQRQLAEAAAGQATMNAQDAVTQRDIAAHTFSAATDTANALVFDLGHKFRSSGVPAAVIEDILTEVRNLQDQLVAGGDASPELRVSQAAALNESAKTLLTLGRPDDALRAAQQASDIAERLVNAYPNHINYLRQLSIGAERLGDVFTAKKDLKQALSAYGRSRDSLDEVLRLDPSDVQSIHSLIGSLLKVGDVERQSGDKNSAIDAFQKGLKLSEQLVRSTNSNEAKRDLSASLQKLGTSLFALGDNEAGLKAFEESLTLAENLVKGEPKNPEFQSLLQHNLQSAGSALALAVGKTGGVQQQMALEYLSRSSELASDLHNRDRDNIEWRDDFSQSLAALGKFRLALNDLQGALAVLEKRRDLIQSLADATSRQELWDTYLFIGDVYYQMNQPDNALKTYQLGFNVAKELVDKYPDSLDIQRDLLDSFINIADAKWAEKDDSGALAEYKESVQIAGDLALKFPADTQSKQDLSDTLADLVSRDPGQAVEAIDKVLRDAMDRHAKEGLTDDELLAVKKVALASVEKALSAGLANLVSRDPGRAVEAVGKVLHDATDGRAKEGLTEDESLVVKKIALTALDRALSDRLADLASGDPGQAVEAIDKVLHGVVNGQAKEELTDDELLVIKKIALSALDKALSEATKWREHDKMAQVYFDALRAKYREITGHDP